MVLNKENASVFHNDEDLINQYRNTYALFPICVKLLSKDGRILYMNAAGLQMIEADNVEQVTNHFIRHLISKESQVAFFKLHSKVFSGESGNLEFQAQGLKGTQFWFETNASPVRNQAGEICAYLGLTQDISVRKQVEQSLLASEQRFRTLIEVIPQMVWSADKTGAINFVSQQVEDYFDLPSSYFLTEGWMKVVHPDDLSQTITKMMHALETGTTFEVQFRLKRSDNTYRWHIGRARPVYGENKQITQWVGANTDIDALKQSEDALRESDANFAAAQASAKIGSWHRDLITGETKWSLEMYRLFSFDPANSPPPFEKFQDKIHPEDRSYMVMLYEQTMQPQEIYSADFRYPDQNGDYLWLEAKIESHTDETGRIIAISGTTQDITDRKKIERAFQTSEQLLNTSQSIAKLGGWELDLITKELFWTDETYRLHDTSPDEFNPTLDAGMEYFLPASRQRMADALKAAIDHGQTYDLELEKLTTKGRKIDVRVTCEVTMQNGKAVRLTGVFQDITQQKAEKLALKAAYEELEKSNLLLEHIAHYDPLTNLPNRVLLADRMQQAMLHCQRRQQSLAVAFLDLDGFKDVNDQFGHSVGDQLLIDIAHRLKLVLREGDTLARIGGDEFVAILTDLHHGLDCEPVLARLLMAASEPILVNNTQVQVSASIGVTIYPQDGVDADQLLRHADQAMYISKQAGKNCYHLFDVAHDAAIKTQRDDLSQIRQAMSNQEFVLFYQPKVNMRSGKVIGAEALIRWQHPQKGLLAPGAFLHIIENHNVSIELGEWVISTGLSQIVQWKSIGLNLPVSVNVGALQLQQSNFPERLKHLLSIHPESIASYLELEVLETSALGDIEQISKVIHACQTLGVSFALDDFGTGYSSLSYLKQLPANMLKIDQSFVRDMLEDEGDLNIIKGIVGLAAAFNRNVIAEGVETIAHGNNLLSLGCELAQGYGIARPMPAAAIEDWIQTWQSAFTIEINQ